VAKGDLFAIDGPDSLLVVAATQPKVRVWLVGITLETDASLRALAARALAPSATEPDVRSRLLALTYDENDEVRWHAASSLRTAIYHPVVTARLIDLMSDRHSWVRESAVLALRPLADMPMVLREILWQTWHAGKWLREAATWALSDLVTKPRVLRRFLSLTRDPSSRIHRIVAGALAMAYRNPDISARQRRSILRMAARFANNSVHGLELLEELVGLRTSALYQHWPAWEFPSDKPPWSTRTFRQQGNDSDLRRF